MPINPAGSGSCTPPGAGRPEGAEKPLAGKPGKPSDAREAPGHAVPDGVELSDAARELSEKAASEAPPSGTLSPDQLRHLAQRIADGHYDRPEVRDQVAASLLKALNDPSTGA